MKAIIDVAVKSSKSEYSSVKADMLAVGVFSPATELKGLAKQLDGKLAGAIGEIAKLGDFKGKQGTTAMLYSGDKIAAKRVLLVGMGEIDKVELDHVRKAAAAAANKAMGLGAASVALALHEGLKLDYAEVGRAIGEGFYMGSFKYDEYTGDSEDGRARKLTGEVIEPDAKKLSGLKEGLTVGVITGEAQSLARTLANRPGNVINPATLAAEARKLASKIPGLSCQIFNEKQLAEKKMGGILAVGQGSAVGPRLIVLKWSPARAKVKTPVAIVGKAVTFDSGGISLKPGANMDEMKLDKTGGVTVLATMGAVAKLKLPVTVYGFIPAAENMPSATAYRPGDIVTTYSGKTVEILNTDAEGRMILCDAIALAAQQKCDPIIDIATLTGACKVALGKYYGGLMGNDDELIKSLQEASTASGEKVWHLPCGEEYLDEMKSKIADLKNTGSRWGGASSAAAFLGNFAGKSRWAHLDIAGVDMWETATRFTAEGGSGFGVRLLVAYLRNLPLRG